MLNHQSVAIFYPLPWPRRIKSPERQINASSNVLEGGKWKSYGWKGKEAGRK